MLPTPPTSTRPSAAQGARPIRLTEDPPLHWELDPEARYFLWIDPRGGSRSAPRPRPALVMLLARTTTDDGVPTFDDRRALEHFLALTQLEAQYEWTAGPNSEEAHWIGSGAQSILAPTRDDHRPLELVVIAYDSALEERSRRRLGPGPDPSPPPTFDRRISIELLAAELPRGAWIDTPGLATKVQANLQIRDRWLLAPGGEGQVTWWGTSVQAQVPKDELHFRGSPRVHAKVNPPPELLTLAALLSAPVKIERGMAGGERVREQRSALDLYVGERPLPRCCGVPLRPFGDEALVEGPHFGLERHLGADADVWVVRLHEVLVAAPGESLLGWSLDVGFRDEDGFEAWAKQLFKCGGASSGAQALAMSLPKGRHGALELIVRDAGGVPLHRRSVVL